MPRRETRWRTFVNNIITCLLKCCGGKEVQCGWLQDKFGVSWQIVPRILGELLGDQDEARTQMVMQALLHMIKIDIECLRQAYEQ
jgi:predicted 3-demethylubiquinone-9 3-methyltransferase (glyoxalase superfamily)